jgi:hypothetical protein
MRRLDTIEPYIATVEQRQQRAQLDLAPAGLSSPVAHASEDKA